MAIAKMAKVMVAAHRSQASELLEALQADGICQILNAEQAMVSKDSPELCCEAAGCRDIQRFVEQLSDAVEFLKGYIKSGKTLTAVLAPLTVVDEQSYSRAVSDKQIPAIVEQTEKTRAKIEQLKNEYENVSGTLSELMPWKALETPVEQIGELEQAACLAGFIPEQSFEQITEQADELGLAIQQVGRWDNHYACLVICMKEQLGEVQKLLRSADFQAVSFEHMNGTAAELITQYEKKLAGIRKQLGEQNEQAALLAKNLTTLEIVHDHYSNLLNREQTKSEAPATESTVLLEGWVKQKHYHRLEKVVSAFDAADMCRIEPGEDEEPPVEIENNRLFQPFEVITRLYGMPKHFNIDPTALLAPFFAIFFALCLTDAGYGIAIIVLAAFFIKKMQGDKKLMWMLGICSVVTVVAGVLTGGWFGDAIQQFIPALKPAREKLMWFDPLEKPMMFFVLALALGYFQIITGLVIAFVHNLKRKQYAAAVCDQLTWLVMLNSIVIFGASKGGLLPAGIGKFFGLLAIGQMPGILLFSHRQGGWAGRLGMGSYNLFSSIFYMGDVLSYLRLMALGMVTAGLAMAVNIIAKIAMDIPVVGFIVMIVVLVIGHGFNIALSGLSAFVHTLRLQYVEFFPKFLIGGGRLFQPLTKTYKHIYIRKV